MSSSSERSQHKKGRVSMKRGDELTEGGVSQSDFTMVTMVSINIHKHAGVNGM